MISKKSKIIAALSLSMMIGLGSTAFAATNSTSKETKKPNKMMEMFKNKKAHGNDGFGQLIQKLGLTKEDIATAKNSGKTLFDLAKEKGYTADQVREMLVQIKTECINKAVTDGKLTKEKADELISKAKEQASKWDGSIKYFNHNDKHKKGEEFFSPMEALGLTKQDIAAAKKSGKTIFDLAKEKKGMTADQVKAALIKAETDKINKRVTEGKMTKEKADAMIAKIKERIEKWDGSLKPAKPLEKQHNKFTPKTDLQTQSQKEAM